MDEKKLEKIVKNSKIMIATPMYGAMCSMEYLHGALNFVAHAHQMKLDFQLETLGNESLVPRARNVLTDKFMNSDCTHLMWIDADMSFWAKDILKLLSLDKDICTGLVCKKVLNWARVSDVAKQDKDNALTPANLKSVSGNIAFIGLPGPIDMTKIFEIKFAGNAFLMIKRKVLEKYRQEYPHLKYVDIDPGANNLGNEKIERQRFAYFDSGICEETNSYLSEDYFFSRNARKIGFKIWADPELTLGHIGNYNYKTDLQELASLIKFSSS